MIDEKRLDELVEQAGFAEPHEVEIPHGDTLELIRLARLGLWATKYAVPALQRTVIYARPEGIWINSRVKGSAMLEIRNTEPEVFESFKESARLTDEALAALPKEGK